MARRSLGRDVIIDRFRKIHGDFYGYERLVYSRIDKQVVITCPDHGDFNQIPINHLAGSGCPTCASEKESRRRGYGLEGFLAKAELVHGQRYDYTEVRYSNISLEVTILCKDHGRFDQIAGLHLSGSGCPACARVKPLNTEVFIDRAIQKHGDLYDYSKVDYVNLNTKVVINCYQHGDFTQLPCNHLAGTRCPKCSNKYRMQDDWLDSLGLPTAPENRQVTLMLYDGSRIVADGYNPSTLTVYEFWGDKWHGNPDVVNLLDIHPVTKTTYGFLYERTQAKIQKIKSSGYHLIDIWESDWIRSQL